MISNPIEILAHHVKFIREDCRNNDPNAIRQWAVNYVESIATHKFPNGLPSYPGLENSEKFEQFVYAHEVAATAIMTKHYRVIRETIESQSQFDLICRACGNYDDRNSAKPRCLYVQRFSSKP